MTAVPSPLSSVLLYRLPTITIPLPLLFLQSCNFIMVAHAIRLPIESHIFEYATGQV